jgi:G3E family GTPase
MKRKGRFDGIIVETTGLADPAPVAQTFFVDDDVKRATKLDAIVTVVDAKHLPARLDDSKEAAEQIAFADIIVLNKMDLVTEAEAVEVERRIRAINPYAEIRRSTKSDVPISAVIGRDAFNLERILEREPEFLDGEHDHEHDSEVNSVSFEVSRPVDPERFNAWISNLLQIKGQDLLRTKGILYYTGETRRFAFQAVHMIADGDYIGEIKPDDPRRSKIVFIGRDLNRPQLRRGFEGTLADAPAADLAAVDAEVARWSPDKAAGA